MGINVAIVGTGFMGQQHGQRLTKMENVSVGAICDVNLQLAQGLKEKLGVPANCYDTFGTMLKKERLDAIYFCIPPFAHNGEVEKAAKKGIHVFIEKPIALTAKRAESMVRAIEAAGVISQVGFHYRFRKSVAKLKEMLATGAAGAPTLFEGRFWCNFQGGAWWRDVSKSGGQVYEQVTHLYDLALFLLGDNGKSRTDVVVGFMNNLCHTAQQDYTVEDTSIGTAHFTNGSMAAITGSNCAVPDHFIFDFRAVFGNVVLDYRSTGDWRIKDESTLIYTGGGSVRNENFIEDGDVYLEESRDFINAIEKGSKTLTPACQGLACIKFVSAVIKSSKNNGKSITIRS